jgi:hypothetical protein
VGLVFRGHRGPRGALPQDFLRAAAVIGRGGLGNGKRCNPKPMPRFNEPILPMTLGNMWANGVHSHAVSCNLCDHRAPVGVNPGM